MANTTNYREIALPTADCPGPSQTAEWPYFQPIPASESPTLDRPRQSPAPYGGGSTPSRDSRNLPPHSAPKAMGKARRNPQLMVGHIIEQHPHRMAKREGAAAHIHGYVKHLASGAAHQLSLRLHQLVMQPAQHATPAARLVVLYQLGNPPLPAEPRESPGEGSASVCSSLEQGLPPALVLSYHSTVRRKPSCTLACGVQSSSAQLRSCWHQWHSAGRDQGDATAVDAIFHC